MENTAGMRGSELSLLVGGAWSSYRSYIVRYLRQMAVITPYARFRLSVSTKADRGTLQLEYARRSEEMPKPPTTIKHHPASVHAELLSALLKETREKQLSKFLSKDFSCIDAALAARMIAELRMSKEMEVYHPPMHPIATSQNTLPSALGLWFLHRWCHLFLLVGATGT